MQLPRQGADRRRLPPELLGVGFIIGPRIAWIMFGGSALAWLIMIPAISLWGGDNVVYPATDPMSSLESGRSGATTCATWARARWGAPASSRSSSRPDDHRVDPPGGRHVTGGAGGEVLRTQRDLPMKLVMGLALLMAGRSWLWPGVPVNFLGAILIVIFSFFS